MKGPPTEATLIRSVIPQHVYLLRRQWSLYRKAYDTHAPLLWESGRPPPDVRPYAAPKEQQSKTQSEYLLDFQTPHWTHKSC